MATTNYTFSFGTSMEGWTGYPDGKTVFAHNASTGNPGDGCISVSLSSKNENPGDEYMEWIGTWEDIGVPNGSNTTEIGSGSLNDYHWRCAQYATVGANVHVGPFQIYDTGGTLIGTISTERADPTAVSTWTTANGTAIAVPSSMQGSTKQLALRMYTGVQTGNSNSAIIEFLYDEISFTISYSAAAPAGGIVPQAMSYFHKRRQ